MQEQQQQEEGNASARDLIIECAAAVSAGDWQRAIHYMVLLRRISSPQGDSLERLTFYFTAALARRVSHSEPAMLPLIHSFLVESSSSPPPGQGEDEYSAYLALNQVTPLIRFAHLSANQAILEAVEGEQAIHIVDLGIMQGLQWPPLMQALAERCRSRSEEEDVHHEPPVLRITGTGPSFTLLEQTGSRLQEFARNLGIAFEFTPATADTVEVCNVVEVRPGEALIVNSMTQLHTLLPHTSLRGMLESVRGLSPKIFTIAEREANMDSEQGLIERILAAVDHYSALFDSLEATLPHRSTQRLAIERLVYGKEIFGIVVEEGDINFDSSQVVRYQKFSDWEMLMQSVGFQSVPASAFTVAQARLLLRLHYPADGYRLQQLDEQGCLFLNWNDSPLVAVSAWRCSSLSPSSV